LQEGPEARDEVNTADGHDDNVWLYFDHVIDLKLTTR
jgi:hypothetical protein